MSDGTDDSADPPSPLLRVVRGTPTSEELAALVAAFRVVAAVRARPAGRPRSPVPAPSGWVRITRPGVTTAGLPAERGPHAWRSSTLPH